MLPLEHLQPESADEVAAFEQVVGYLAEEHADAVRLGAAKAYSGKLPNEALG